MLYGHTDAVPAYYGPVFIFEGDDCGAIPSPQDVDGEVAPIDVEIGSYEYFGVDGTVFHDVVVTGTGRTRKSVVLRPTGERRPEELHARLRVYLAAVTSKSPEASLKPSLAEDPEALAELMLQPRPATTLLERLKGSDGRRWYKKKWIILPLAAWAAFNVVLTIWALARAIFFNSP